ncbi:MAG: aminoacyl-tRNA hydrolase [Chitinophagaceae bacterium]|nr:aminoacyl-tRNA hydrolase [Chitinophagaceae bacterium]
MSKFLIAGLGNIGAEYSGTRHNIGFDIADALVTKHGASFRSDRLADVAEYKWRGKMLWVIKPTTYMNLSGKAIRYWMDKEKIGIDNMLVLLDDLALPMNKIRIRPAGSDAGHNGLTSIQETLDTDKYARLRFGVGNNFPKGGQVEYVLGKWTSEELPQIRFKIEKSVLAVENFIVQGVSQAMNQWNNLEISL